MYWNILKRDIKQEKTMNVILLLFTILAAVFVASGLNNVVTVMNGTDYFFEKAGIKDYVLFTQNGDGGVEQILKTSGCVKDYSMEKCIWGTNGDVTYQGEKLKVKNNTLLIQSLDTTQFHYFLEDNQELTEIADGEIYITAGSFARNDMHVGDTIRIQMKNTDKTFRVAGEIKDALLGSDLMGNTRFLLSENDFKAYEADKSLEPYLGRIFQVETDDTGIGKRNQYIVFFRESYNPPVVCYGYDSGDACACAEYLPDHRILRDFEICDYIFHPGGISRDWRDEGDRYPKCEDTAPVYCEISGNGNRWRNSRIFREHSIWQSADRICLEKDGAWQ